MDMEEEIETMELKAMHRENRHSKVSEIEE